MVPRGVPTTQPTMAPSQRIVENTDEKRRPMINSKRCQYSSAKLEIQILGSILNAEPKANIIKDKESYHCHSGGTAMNVVAN